MSAAVAQVCKANFSRAGRIRRQRFGAVASAIAVGMLVAFVLVHASWFVRATVFVPAAMAAVGLLQVRRNTCVAHAAKGTFEHDDFSTTKQSEDDAAASRRVAAGIYRDAILIALAVAAVSAATAFI